jgi:hypothetical protein
MGIFHYLARDQRIRTNFEPKLEVQLQQKIMQFSNNNRANN